MDINLAAHRVGKSLRSHRVLLSAGLERRLAGSAANSRQSQGVPGIFGQLSRRYPGCHSGAQSSDYGREGCDQRGDGGLPPNYMPVIVAAIEAMCQEHFNLHGISATTGGTAPLLIVNGPAVQQLNINYGVNCFGPGVRANATIGRAIRLILMNVGGSIPGVLDKSCLG